ncbi:hypothetical protein [Bradyrhizobium sp.]|nr:hypothetical protein [Bradyrhizobium sp.]
MRAMLRAIPLCQIAPPRVPAAKRSPVQMAKWVSLIVMLGAAVQSG